MTEPTLRTKKDLGLTLIIFILFAAVIIHAFSPIGILRMTYDSYDLIAASASFDTYLSGKNADGHSYLVRAPLHPFILSFVEDKVAVMWWLNLVALFASLFLLFKICRLNNFSVGNTLLALSATLLFFPWLMNFQFFWTESVFIALILLLCYSQMKGWRMSGVIIICLLLFLTRKAGIFFFVAAAGYYLTQKMRMEAMILFVSGVLVFAAWQFLEYSYGSTGYFGIMLGTLDEYYRIHYVEVITSWILPRQIPLFLRSTIVLGMLVLAVYYFRKKIFVVFNRSQNLVLLSIAGIYSVILMSFSGASGYEDAERYLNVVYPLWIVLGISVCTEGLASRSKNQRILIGAIGGLWLLYPFLRTVHHLFWPVV